MPPSKGNHVRVYPGDIIHERYQVLCEIGCGNFSKVYRSIDLLQSKGEEKPVTVAMKILKKEYKRDATYEHRMLQILASKHKSDFVKIPLMLDYFEFKGCPVFIMALHGTSLRNRRLGISKGVVTKQSLQLFAFHILRAIQFIHDECHVVHTDLKPENILIESQQCSERSIGKQWVICDFGSASECVMNNLDSDLISTRPYRAPEVILGNKWHYASDIWSVGCILFEVAIGFRLFEVRDDPSHLHSIHKRINKLPEKFTKRSKHSSKFFNSKGEFLRVPEAVREGQLIMTPMRDFLKDDPLFLDLVQRLLELDPDQRPSAREMLQHPYFNNIREEMQAKEAAALAGSTTNHSSNIPPATAVRASIKSSKTIVTNSDASKAKVSNSPAAVSPPPTPTPKVLEDVGEPILIQSPKDFDGSHRNSNKPTPPATIRAKPQVMEKTSTNPQRTQPPQQQQTSTAPSPTAAAAAAAAALLAKKKASTNDGHHQHHNGNHTEVPQQQQRAQSRHHHRKNSASFYADSESNGLSPVENLHTPPDDTPTAPQSGPSAVLPITATSRHPSGTNHNNPSQGGAQARPTNDSSVLAMKRKKRPPGSGVAPANLTYVPLDSSTTTGSKSTSTPADTVAGPTARPSSRATLSSTQQQLPISQSSPQTSARPNSSGTSAVVAFGSSTTNSRQKDNVRGLPERSGRTSTNTTSTQERGNGARLSASKPAPASVVAHSKPWEDVSAPASRPSTRAIQRDPSDAPAEVLATKRSVIANSAGGKSDPQKKFMAGKREVEINSGSTTTSTAGSPTTASPASTTQHHYPAGSSSEAVRSPPQHVQRITRQGQPPRASPPPQQQTSSATESSISPIQYHNNLQLYGAIGAEQLVFSSATYGSALDPSAGVNQQNAPVVYAVPRTLSTPRQPITRQPASYTLMPRTSVSGSGGESAQQPSHPSRTTTALEQNDDDNSHEKERQDMRHHSTSVAGEEAVVIRGGLKVRPSQPPTQRSTPTAAAASSSSSPSPVPSSAIQDRSGVTKESLHSIPVKTAPKPSNSSASSSVLSLEDQPVKRSVIRRSFLGPAAGTSPSMELRGQEEGEHENDNDEDESHLFYHHPHGLSSQKNTSSPHSHHYQHPQQNRLDDSSHHAHHNNNNTNTNSINDSQYAQQRIITLASSSSSSSVERSPAKTGPTPPPSSSHGPNGGHSRDHPYHHHYHYHATQPQAPPSSQQQQQQPAYSSGGGNAAAAATSSSAPHLLRFQATQHRQDTLSPISPEPSSASLGGGAGHSTLASAPVSPYPVVVDAQDVGVMVPPSPLPGRGYLPKSHVDYAQHSTPPQQQQSQSQQSQQSQAYSYQYSPTGSGQKPSMRMPLPHAASKPDMLLEDSGEIMWHDGANARLGSSSSRLLQQQQTPPHTFSSAPQPPRQGERVYRISKSYTPREGDIYAPPPSRPGTRSQPQPQSRGSRGSHGNASSLPVGSTAGLTPVPPGGNSSSSSAAYVDINPAKQGFSFTTPQPGAAGSARPRGSARGSGGDVGDSARLASTVKLQPTTHRGQSEQPPHHLNGLTNGGLGRFMAQEAWHASPLHDEIPATAAGGNEQLLAGSSGSSSGGGGGGGVTPGPAPPSRSSAYKVYAGATSSGQRLDSVSQPQLGKLRGAPNLLPHSGNGNGNPHSWGENSMGTTAGNNNNNNNNNNSKENSNSNSAGSPLMKRHISRTSPVPIDPNVPYLSSSQR